MGGVQVLWCGGTDEVRFVPRQVLVLVEPIRVNRAHNRFPTIPNFESITTPKQVVHIRLLRRIYVLWDRCTCIEQVL